MVDQNPNRLLVADGDAADRELLRSLGETLGFIVRSVADEAELRAEVAHWNPTVIALDPATLGVSPEAVLHWLGF